MLILLLYMDTELEQCGCCSLETGSKGVEWTRASARRMPGSDCGT